MSAHIEDLPAEVVLQVLEHTSNLESLDNLLRASPNIFRTFEEYAAPVLDKVLDNGYIHPHTQNIIRLVALIRSGQFPFTTLGEVQSRVTSVALIPERYRDPRLPAPFHLSSLPRNTSAVILGILATARRLLLLSSDLLQVHLQRFSQINPLISTEPRRTRSVKSALKYLNRSLGSKVSIHDNGPPSWIEEQLLCRGFWQMQLLEDLKCAVENGIGPHWSNLERHKLHISTIHNIYDFGEMAYVDNLLIRKAGGRSFHGYVETVDQGIVSTIQDYLAERHRDPLSSSQHEERSWPSPKACLKERNGFDTALSFVFEEYARVFVGDEWTEIIPFSLYRRLGMSIWDAERLAGYGIDLTNKLDTVAWLSILQPQDLAVLKGKRYISQRTWAPSARKPVLCFGDRIYEHVNPVVQGYRTMLRDY